jgi:nitrogenase-associated protein
MAIVVFYEKPGCSGNARQKALLEASGHTVVARSIVAERWTRRNLLGFLESLPVASWFNANAPQVKSGEIVPESFDAFDADTVLGLLLSDPLLIRRPLLEVDGVRHAGFEVERIREWIGLSAEAGEVGCAACHHPSDETARCSGHAGEAPHEPGHTLES